ncbi:MAG: class I SAM-dependent methyltransferase [Pseudodesulfovibrio sp.]
MKKETIQTLDRRLEELVPTITELHKDLFEARELEFLNRIMAGGVSKYLKRLQSCGMEGFETVLDAGCGFGQWSLPLALINTNVISLDIHPGRVRFLQSLTEELGMKNISTHLGDVTDTGFAKDSVNAIFSYSVLPFSPWREALAEFTRILTPKGKLYANANGFGWYAYLWDEQPNKSENYDPRQITARAFPNTIAYNNTGSGKAGVDIIIEPKELQKALEELGYTDILTGEDGTMTLPDKEKHPFSRGNYKGNLAVFEILATKK